MNYEELETDLINSQTQIDKIRRIIESRVDLLENKVKLALRKERSDVRNELRFFEKFYWAYEDYNLDFSVHDLSVVVYLVSRYDNTNVYHSFTLDEWLFSDEEIEYRVVDSIEQAKTELKDQIGNNKKALIEELKNQLKQLEEN